MTGQASSQFRRAITPAFLVIVACGASGPGEPPATTQPSTQQSEAYDLDNPVIDSDDAVADGLLLMRLIDKATRHDRWLAAIATHVLDRNVATCDDACVPELFGRLQAMEHPGVKLALTNARDNVSEISTLLERIERTEGVMRERAAVVRFIRARRAAAMHSGVAFMLGRAPICSGASPGMDTASYRARLQECATTFALSSPDWNTLLSSTNGIVTALFLRDLHQAMQVVRTGESRLSKTLVAHDLLDLGVQRPLPFVISPRWVSESPLQVEAAREWESPLRGFVVHVSRTTTRLRPLPLAELGAPLPESFPSAVELTETTWNDALRASDLLQERWDRWEATLPGGDVNEADTRDIPRATQAARDSVLATLRQIHEPPGGYTLQNCGEEAEASPKYVVILVADEDASPANVVRVLQRAAAFDTLVYWLALGPDGEPTVNVFRVGPSSTDRDCEASLDRTSVRALFQQLANTNKKVVFRSP